MHYSTLAFAAAAAGAASAQQMSICDKYTTALLKDNTAANQYTLLTLLVNTAGIGNYTGPGTANPTLPGSMVTVPGILAPGNAEGEDVNLLPYFSGALASTNRNGMPASVSFVDGGGAEAIIANATSAGMPGSNQERLFTHLYSYFGKLLGCSAYGQMGFPSYSGGASQYEVHKYMDLDHAQVTWFIQQVGLSAKSFGASDDDISTVAMTLENTFNYRCSPAAELIPSQGSQLQSICQNSTCPLDPKNMCAAYPNNGAVSAPAPAATGASSASASGSAVSMISDGQPQGATSAAGAITQISDNQPQAPTSAVSQISDNQPQAPTMAGTPMSTPAQYTGAAAANAVPAIAAGAVGLAAALL